MNTQRIVPNLSANTNYIIAEFQPKSHLDFPKEPDLSANFVEVEIASTHAPAPLPCRDLRRALSVCLSVCQTHIFGLLSIIHFAMHGTMYFPTTSSVHQLN